VYVIQGDSTVKQQPIKIQATEGEVSAATGVDPGAEVVTDGFDRLQNGSKVAIRTPNANGDAGNSNSNSNSNSNKGASAANGGAQTPQ
jgi:multidrug efflux system membrane fusion protein